MNSGSCQPMKKWSTGWNDGAHLLHALALHPAKGFLAALAVILLASGAQAQPSVGSLLKQIQGETPPVTLPQTLPKVESAKAQEQGSDTIKFVVKRFDFVGNTRLSSDELQTVVAPYLNRPVTSDDLKAAADAIAEHYRQRGWLVRAYLPQQDITDGVVTIRVVEASLGGLVLDNPSKRVSNARVEAWIYGRIPRGSLLSLDELDRTLLTLGDMPDVSVTGSLQTGEKPGETVLGVTVADKPLVDAVLGVDNFGSASTGQNRGTLALNVNGALGLGDQLGVYGLYTEGTRYARLSLTAPGAGNGLRVGVNTSYLRYRVVNASFAQLGVDGSSHTGGLELA